MKARTEMSAQQQTESGACAQQKSELRNGGTAGKPSLGQNVIGTIKVILIAALVIAALWGLDRLVSNK